METEEREQRLKFVLEILGHPELMREEYVREWLSREENRNLYDECRVYLEAGLRLEVGNSLDVDMEYERFCQNMAPRVSRVWTRWVSVAAGMVLVFACGWWLSTLTSEVDVESARLVAEMQPENIEPGKNQAVLITESGERIVLGSKIGNGIEIEDGIKIDNDSLNGIAYMLTEGIVSRYHTLSVPKGGEYKIVLSDGTVVWLNSESELRYPTVFEGESRRVELKGEAYFSVTHDGHTPFVVVTSGVRTKVYGTEFNVRSYAGREVNVTLVKGRVAVKRENTEKEFMLNPGENARFHDATPEIEKVNVQKYTAWKDGYFYYENERLETIMEELKRWYDFDVIYVNNQLKDLKFELWASRNSEMQQITDLLRKTNKVNMKVDGWTLIISEVNR